MTGIVIVVWHECILFIFFFKYNDHSNELLYYHYLHHLSFDLSLSTP